ncbi:MAG: hypothetical protein QXQ40_00640 [Candidatus Aenigmatarchaeota archaeon]
MSRASAVLSESVMAIISIVISFMLIAIFAKSTFSHQSDVAYEQAMNSIARDLATSIDRACGLAGSTKFGFEIPKGMHFNLTVDYKSVWINYNGNVIKKSFSCITHMVAQEFKDPKELCIVKNMNDRRVIITEGKCKCDVNDGICDPACIAEGLCDPACYSDSQDNVCNPFCAKDNDGVCDPDCYRNETDSIWDLDCKNPEKDNICDPDTYNVSDNFCDPDCYAPDSKICDPDCKPKDKDGDKIEDEKDGICYTGCINTTIQVSTSQPNYNIIPNYSCDTSDARNARCASEKMIYACGQYRATCSGTENYCIHRNWSDFVDCAMHKPLSPEELEKYINEVYPRMMNSEVCCCDSTGKCRRGITYLDCVLSGSQSYPLSHEYCKGLSSSTTIPGSSAIQKEIKFLIKDGICDLDCLERDDVCDPDCTNDTACEFQCAKLGENCTELPPCSDEGICCPGDKIVRKNCCGNNICETREMWLHGNETKWENFYTCREDCQANKHIANPNDTAHMMGNVTDGVCDRVIDNVTDIDCCASVDSNGMCTGFKEPSTYKFCDPDGSWLPGCLYANTQDQTNAGVPDNICTIAEGDGCDPDCANSTELCDPDCCPFNSPSPCPSSPGCYCPARVGKGNFTSGFWYSDTNSPNCDEHNPQQTSGVLGVCSDEAIKFLNRRGWDIKQVARTITAPTPEGWAFDYSRYITIISEGVQKVIKTIKANEEYTKSDSICCCTSNCPCALCEIYNECCGVGFCGDHGPSVASILRTLGVPAKDVFVTFVADAGCRRHSFAVYKCDPDLPEHLKLEQCDGHWGEWLMVDATFHAVTPLRGSGACNNLCIWYNDIGTYHTINASIYGFGGLINETHGRPFPAETGCNSGAGCVFKKLCPMFGIECVS